ncbi:TBC1 domain family member 19 [Onthophagus taurus]|uniref:TBC1 domain family member 19 n=1 Tax=Onthophagus taurus TaxID=166361 RepID=UPI000C20A876|nr:TBC1 domain family member 19 [Onthophagus taurus]XP_022901540.1 TBC1 domain family member 19 [Onthophagus taurus]
MDELKEKGIHQTAINICEDLKESSSYAALYREIQKLVSCQEVKYEDFKRTLSKAMKDQGLECQLRNNVFQWVRLKNADMATNMAYLRRAQINWDKRIHKSLNSMCNELGIDLAKVRFLNERDELADKWNEMSNYDVDVSKYRPVYAPKDFLEVLLNLKDPFFVHKENDPEWEFTFLPLEVKDLEDLRTLYLEFSRGEQILGAYTGATYAAFEEERMALGQVVLQKNYAPIAQEYLKKGCPRSLRAKMWSLVLGVGCKFNEQDYFHNLKKHVFLYDLMIDKLIIKDIQLTTSNDDQYFVFEDVLYQVMLCFSRDTCIIKHLKNQPGYMQVVLKNKPHTPENIMAFPPSGVIPFHGFTMYAAPICYLYSDPSTLYFVFRAFYLRYWNRLHVVCDHPQGIVALCLLFERLLQSYAPKLWIHFTEIDIPPLRIVFKWLMRAFSGHLPPEQLLQLWDIVLAYDSLEVIPLLAVVILIFRKDNLLQVTTLSNIEAVLADLSSITVIPLLQMALLKE